MKIVERQDPDTLVPDLAWSGLGIQVARKLTILTILENKDVIKGADVQKG